MGYCRQCGYGVHSVVWLWGIIGCVAMGCGYGTVSAGGRYSDGRPHGEGTGAVSVMVSLAVIVSLISIYVLPAYLHLLVARVYVTKL